MRLREFDEKERLEKANEKLGKYKTAAGADAAAADASGNFTRGNTRFKGINRATKKQFANDAKKSQLKEFAPSGDDGDEFNEKTLKSYAAQWLNNNEDPRVEKTLMRAGWEIGQDAGYDKGGVFVVRAGDDQGDSYISWPAEELRMNEVAPPGARAERMVRHIKQGYARDGKLTPREKGIAFATAWKAHNAGQVEEATEDEYQDDYEDEETELCNGCYVRDKEDSSGEIFVMRGDPGDRRVRIEDRHGRGWNIAPYRLTVVDDSDPDIAAYFGDELDEAGVADPSRRGFLKKAAGAAAAGVAMSAAGPEIVTLVKGFAEQAGGMNGIQALKAMLKIATPDELYNMYDYYADSGILEDAITESDMMALDRAGYDNWSEFEEHCDENGVDPDDEFKRLTGQPLKVSRVDDILGQVDDTWSLEDFFDQYPEAMNIINPPRESLLSMRQLANIDTAAKGANLPTPIVAMANAVAGLVRQIFKSNRQSLAAPQQVAQTGRAAPALPAPTRPEFDMTPDLKQKEKVPMQRKGDDEEPADPRKTIQLLVDVGALSRGVLTDKSGMITKEKAQELLNKYYDGNQDMAEGEYDSRKPFGVRYKVFAGREGRMTTREYWTSSEEKLQRAVEKIQALDNFYEIDGYSYPKESQGVAENKAAGINKMFNNLGDPVYANLQRVALLAMQGRQSDAAGRLQTVIKHADPAVQKKITDAVNNIKPVTINGRVADSSTLDKSKQHNDWTLNTFIPWVQSLLGHQDVTEAKTVEFEGVAEGLDPNREAAKTLQNLKNLALMKSALTSQQLRQAGRESMLTDAINACIQYEQSYLQNKQQGNAIFVRALRDEIDNFRKGYPINSSMPEDNAPELGDLLQGKLGKINFQQGVAEGSEQKPAITYKDYTLQYDYQTEDDDPEGYSTATTYYFDVLKDGDRVGEAEYFDYFGNLTIRINGKTKEFGFRHPLASQISQLVSSLPDEQKKDLSDPRFESQGLTEVFADQGSGSTDRDNADYMKRRRAAKKAGYTGRETKAGTWRVFKDGNAVAAAGPFKSADEAAAWIKKHKQGVTEMDKSEPSAGRDTGPRPGPDREAKPITAKKATRDAGRMLNRAFQDSHKKKDVKETQLDELSKDTLKDYMRAQPARIKGPAGLATTNPKKAARIVNPEKGDMRRALTKLKDPAYGQQGVAEDSISAMRRLAGIVTPPPAVVSNGPRQYRHMPTAVQPR